MTDRQERADQVERSIEERAAEVLRTMLEEDGVDTSNMDIEMLQVKDNEFTPAMFDRVADYLIGYRDSLAEMMTNSSPTDRKRIFEMQAAIEVTLGGIRAINGYSDLFNAQADTAKPDYEAAADVLGIESVSLVKEAFNAAFGDTDE
jgi:hypothetical protein